MSREAWPGADLPKQRTVERDGISVSVPWGWESRIRHFADQRDDTVTKPVLHAATVPLPSRRADYGSGVVESLSSTDVFVALLEFGEEAVGSRLFPEVQEIPVLEPAMLHPSQLQRTIRGQAGKQIFFTYRGRAFCLYVVIGSNALRTELAAKANELIVTLEIESNRA